MKLFISYSRDDAGNFAKHIHRFMINKGHNVFIDVTSITIGDPWARSIEKNISECDIFVVILTPDSLTSTYVEREVLQAQKQNKIIVPCIHEHVEYSEIKWGLEESQGIEFSDKYDLALNLYPKIKNYKNLKNENQNTIENTNISGDANSLYDKGIDFFTHNKYQEAIECFKALNVNPNYTLAQDNKKLALERLSKEKPSSSYDTISKGTMPKGWKSSSSSYFDKNTVVDNVKTPNILTKSGDAIIHQKKNLPQPLKEERTIEDEISTSKDNIKKYSFISCWGNRSFGDVGELLFKEPDGIAVDISSGYVYVADSLNHRIQKFDSDGNFITKWGSKGEGDGEFYFPNGIDIDSSSGYVYVTEQGSHHVQKFDSNGKFIIKWGSKGNGEGQFMYFRGISVDSSSGYVYVADCDNHRIQKFDTNGNFITKWGRTGIKKLGRKGSGNGEFNNPRGICVNSSTGYVYVADSDNNRIQIFAPSK